MKTWKMMSKKSLGMAVLSAAFVLTTGVSAEAAPSMMSDVPVDNWSYESVNTLISEGAVPDYTMTIPEGRIMSRMEMAMIVDSAMQNEANMTPNQQAELSKLSTEYYYDIKKVQMLSKIDNMDVSGDAKGESGLTDEERASLKKAADFADRFSVDGYARFRNDHYLKNSAEGGPTEKTTRANMVHVQVNTAYKVNDDWQVHTDLGYRSTFSGFDEYRTLSPGENQTGLTVDPYVTGTFPKLGLDVKAGKWNEWNVYGWGMDIDCDFSGVQLTQGKKDFKTFFTMGKMDLWDNAMGGTRDQEQITSLRFYYPFDKKNDVNFGVAWTSPMASRYQDPDQGRVFYYYAHGHHKFDDNWAVRAGIINSNAKRDPANAEAGTKTKSPGRWLQVNYKGADISKPNSYGVTMTYRYEPALTWPTVTDWCGLNEKFLRLGFAYVPTKNVLLDTFYSWGREIDTDARSDMFRFQAQLFF